MEESDEPRNNYCVLWPCRHLRRPPILILVATWNLQTMTKNSHLLHETVGKSNILGHRIYQILISYLLYSWGSSGRLKGIVDARTRTSCLGTKSPQNSRLSCNLPTKRLPKTQTTATTPSRVYIPRSECSSRSCKRFRSPAYAILRFCQSSHSQVLSCRVNQTCESCHHAIQYSYAELVILKLSLSEAPQRSLPPI